MADLQGGKTLAMAGRARWRGGRTARVSRRAWWHVRAVARAHGGRRSGTDEGVAGVRVRRGGGEQRRLAAARA